MGWVFTGADVRLWFQVKVSMKSNSSRNWRGRGFGRKKVEITRNGRNQLEKRSNFGRTGEVLDPRTDSDKVRRQSLGQSFGRLVRGQAQPRSGGRKAAILASAPRQEQRTEFALPAAPVAFVRRSALNQYV